MDSPALGLSVRGQRGRAGREGDGGGGGTVSIRRRSAVPVDKRFDATDADASLPSGLHATTVGRPYLFFISSI